MDKFLEYRKKYEAFRYTGFEVAKEDEDIKIEYHFKIDGLREFNPKWRFPLGDNNIEELKENGTFMEMVFSLGMVELISYWKTACLTKCMYQAISLMKSR